MPGSSQGLHVPNAARINSSGVASGRTGSSCPPSSAGGLKAWSGQSDGIAGSSRGFHSILPAPLTHPATSLVFGAAIAIGSGHLGTSSFRFRPVHPSCSIAQPFRPTGQNVWSSVSETCPAIVLSRRTRQHDRPSEPVVRPSRLALPEDGPCGLVHVSTAPATPLSSARTRASSACHSGDRRCSSMEGPSSFMRAEIAITGIVNGAVATAATFEQPESVFRPTTSIAMPNVVGMNDLSFIPLSQFMACPSRDVPASCGLESIPRTVTRDPRRPDVTSDRTGRERRPSPSQGLCQLQSILSMSWVIGCVGTKVRGRHGINGFLQLRLEMSPIPISRNHAHLPTLVSGGRVRTFRPSFPRNSCGHGDPRTGCRKKGLADQRPSSCATGTSICVKKPKGITRRRKGPRLLHSAARNSRIAAFTASTCCQCAKWLALPSRSSCAPGMSSAMRFVCASSMASS